jgi:tRNA threonylcarbamoyladenosine biosynthesis protein TsaB
VFVLALDTTLEACSVAIVERGRLRAARSEPMARGHQERLAPLVEELFTEAGADFSAVERIAVTTGPGSFTGLRVGLAFAKGLGLALDRPVVGVGTLAALAAGAGAGLTAAAIDARRGCVYLQAFRGGAAATEPVMLETDRAVLALIKLESTGPVRLTGPGAGLLSHAFPEAELDARAFADPAAIAQLAAKVRAAAPPRPLYLRPPDARLPA